MQAHRRPVFQMHFLDTGQVRLQLDDHRYSVQAPLFDTYAALGAMLLLPNRLLDGSVLTVREELVWPLLGSIPAPEAFGLPGSTCRWRIEAQQAGGAQTYWQLIERVHGTTGWLRTYHWCYWRRRYLLLLLRNAKLDDHAATAGCAIELKPALPC